MTTIYNQNGLIIESLTVPRAALATGATDNTDVNLDRPARFMGASIVEDMNSGSTGAASGAVNTYLRKTDDSELVFGDAISAVRVVRRNDSGGSRTYGVKVLVFLGR